MKAFTPEADARVRAGLQELRRCLDASINIAHSFGLLGVAVDCFLAQANIQSALDRLETRRLEALAREQAAARSDTAASVRPNRPALLRAFEYRRDDGGIGVCAWCQAELNIKPEPGQSHGICPRHKDFMLSQLGRVNGRKVHETAN